MSTCTQQRKSSSTTLNPTISKEESHVFVSKLVAMAVSNVTYLRGIFPECVYANRQLEGLPLKILRGNEAHAAASQLVYWLKGAFDAMQRNYLRKMILGVHKEGAGPEDVLETYTFKFSYTDDKVDTCHLVQDGVKRSKKVVEMYADPKAVLHCALQMMHGTLFLMRTLEPLPGDVQLSMKLLYYDDVTPDDYEPPGFRPGEYEMCNFECDPLNISIGEVSTPYHFLTFNCKTDSTKVDPSTKQSLLNMSADNAENQNSGNKNDASVEDNASLEDTTSIPMLTLDPSEQDKPEEVSSDECIPSSQIPAASYSGLWKDSTKLNGQITNPITPVSTPEPPPVPAHNDNTQVCNCPCNTNKEVGLLLTCTACYCWSHAACYGFKTDTGIPTGFTCVDCHYRNRGVCVDSKLLSMQPDQRGEICLYRQILAMCQDMELISAAKVIRELSLHRTITDKIMKRLESDNIIKKAKTKGTSRVVNHKILKTVLGQYFHQAGTLALIQETEVEECTKGIEEMLHTAPSSRERKHTLLKTSKSSTKQTPPPKRRRVSRGATSDHPYLLD